MCHLYAPRLTPLADECLISSNVPSYPPAACWIHAPLVFNYTLLDQTQLHQCIQTQPPHSASLSIHYLILTLFFALLRLLHLCICLCRTRTWNRASQRPRTLCSHFYTVVSGDAADSSPTNTVSVTKLHSLDFHCLGYRPMLVYNSIQPLRGTVFS